jgi:regulator of chromosome condensation
MGYNEDGQLGSDVQLTRNPRPIPMNQPAPKFSKILCGGFHSMGITENGEVWDWGWNCDGQLGV